MIRKFKIPALFLSVIVLSLPIILGLTNQGLGEVVVLLFVDMFITALATLAAMRGFALRRWPSTTGVITESKIVAGRGLFNWRDPESDILLVHNPYTVGDQAFDGTLDTCADADIVSKAFGGYPKNDVTVLVYYPNRSHDSRALHSGNDDPIDA